MTVYLESGFFTFRTVNLLQRSIHGDSKKHQIRNPIFPQQMVMCTDTPDYPYATTSY